MRHRLILSAIVLAFGVNAHADSVSFTLLNPAQSTAGGGETLSFSATVSAPSTNTAAEDLTSLGFNINPSNTFQVDESGFLNDFPLSLSPGDSYTGSLFNIVVPADAALGAYIGSVVLTGGPNNSVLVTESFTIDVTPATAAATPEPSSFILLGTSVALLAAFVRRQGRGDRHGLSPTS